MLNMFVGFDLANRFKALRDKLTGRVTDTEFMVTLLNIWDSQKEQIDKVEEWKQFHNIEVSNWGNLKTPKNLDGTYKGGDHRDGYLKVMVKIDGKYKTYQVHRLVVHLFNDVALDDSRQVDHINGSRTDNNIDNLRMVTPSENNLNRKCHRDGQLPWVRYDEVRKKWRSTPPSGYVGLYDTEEEAHEVALLKIKEM